MGLAPLLAPAQSCAGLREPLSDTACLGALLPRPGWNRQPCPALRQTISLRPSCISCLLHGTTSVKACKPLCLQDCVSRLIVAIHATVTVNPQLEEALRLIPRSVFLPAEAVSRHCWV